MRRDVEFFGEAELELVQLSRRLRDALDIEAFLTGEGVDYLVEADTYRGRFLGLFPADRVGAFFWVPTARASSVRELLEQRGFSVTVPEGDDARPIRSAARETGSATAMTPPATESGT